METRSDTGPAGYYPPMRRRLLLLPFALLLACSAPDAVPLLEAPSPLPERVGDAFSGPAWVVFADKGPADDLAERLAEAEWALHPRAAARRARNRPDGRAVDRSDLPVHDPYVVALEDLGLRVRHRSVRLNAVSVADLHGLHDEVAALPFVRTLHPVALRTGPAMPTLGPAIVPAGDAPRGEPAPASPYDYGEAEWQAKLIAADELHGEGYTGAQVIVGVTDTGFRMTHEVLAPLVPQVIDSYDFLEDDPEVANETADEDDVDQDFHGSVVVSTLAGKLDGTMVGIAPEVSLLLAKTESVPLEEEFEEDTWIAGAEWAESSGADILSSSLGWTDWYTLPDDLDGATGVSTIFANELASGTGLLIVTSAGNSGPGAGTLFLPADAQEVIAAGAVDENGDVAVFSSRGPTADGRFKPDLAAPGQSVTVVRWDQPDGLQTASGTSFAAPILAGVAALLVEAHPEWTREELTQALKDTASQATAPDNDLGWGLVDGWAACGLECSCRDEDGDGAYADDCGGADCDDDEPNVRPGATELCNEVDDDCDGAPAPDEVDADGDGDLACATDCDDGDASLNGLDLDGDGDPSCGTDCDDTNPAIEGLDHDGDGTSLCGGDCADGDASISPDQPEVPYDGIDQDCDGADLDDVDGDGVIGGPDGADCADDDPSIFPDPPLGEGEIEIAMTGGHELCFDGRDNDCDGLEGTADPDCRAEALAEAGGSSSFSTTFSSDGSGCALQVGGRSPASAALLLALLALGVRRGATRSDAEFGWIRPRSDRATM